MHPILFKLGPLTIYTYGVFVFLGLVSGLLVSRREAQRLGIEAKDFSDIIFFTLLGAFLGARIFYIIVEFKWFLARPWEVIFSRSGFIFYGGVISGMALLYFMAKQRKISFFRTADCIVLGLPLGHALGRLGCFFYGCCYGRAANSFIGVLFPPDSLAGASGVKVIPTQLISAVFLFLIFLALFFLRKYKRFSGQLVAGYLWMYGLFRFIIEFFRGDDRLSLWGFSLAQIISVLLVLIGAYLYNRLSRNNRSN